MNRLSGGGPVSAHRRQPPAGKTRIQPYRQRVVVAIDHDPRRRLGVITQDLGHQLAGRRIAARGRPAHRLIGRQGHFVFVQQALLRFAQRCPFRGQAAGRCGRDDVQLAENALPKRGPAGDPLIKRADVRRQRLPGRQRREHRVEPRSFAGTLEFDQGRPAAEVASDRRKLLGDPLALVGKFQLVAPAQQCRRSAPAIAAQTVAEGQRRLIGQRPDQLGDPLARQRRSRRQLQLRHEPTEQSFLTADPAIDARLAEGRSDRSGREPDLEVCLEHGALLQE